VAIAAATAVGVRAPLSAQSFSQPCNPVSATFKTLVESGPGNAISLPERSLRGPGLNEVPYRADRIGANRRFNEAPAGGRGMRQLLRSTVLHGRHSHAERGTIRKFGECRLPAGKIASHPWLAIAPTPPRVCLRRPWPSASPRL
jgi:hypothetical protein